MLVTSYRRLPVSSMLPTLAPCCRLLHADNPGTALACAISTVSQVARLHQDFYGPLGAGDLCGLLRPLLTHPEAGVRARTCNLLGNLCRHSPAFYRPLQRSGLLPLLIQRCHDADRATRKFACFALGNAGRLCRLTGHTVPLSHLLPPSKVCLAIGSDALEIRRHLHTT